MTSWMKGLSDSEFEVLMFFFQESNFSGDWIRCSQKFIADHVQLSIHTVRKALYELIAKGHIERHRCHVTKLNSYRIIDPSFPSNAKYDENYGYSELVINAENPEFTRYQQLD